MQIKLLYYTLDVWLLIIKEYLSPAAKENISLTHIMEKVMYTQKHIEFNTIDHLPIVSAFSFYLIAIWREFRTDARDIETPYLYDWKKLISYTFVPDILTKKVFKLR